MTDVSIIDPGFDDLDYNTALGLGPQRAACPETILWIECVGQLLQDATIEDARIKRTAKSKGEDSPEYIRRTARSTIFARQGVTASWYNTICEMAGLNPEFIRSIAARAIKENRRVRKDLFTETTTGVKSDSTLEEDDENPQDR